MSFEMSTSVPHSSCATDQSRRNYEELEATVLKQGQEIDRLKAQVVVLMQAVSLLTNANANTQIVTSFVSRQQTDSQSISTPPKIQSQSNGTTSMNVKAPSFTPASHTFNAAAKPWTSPKNTTVSYQLPARCEFGTNCRKEHCASLHQAETEGWCHRCRLHCISLLPSEIHGMCYYYKHCFQCGYNEAPPAPVVDSTATSTSTSTGEGIIEPEPVDNGSTNTHHITSSAAIINPYSKSPSSTSAWGRDEDNKQQSTLDPANINGMNIFSYPTIAIEKDFNRTQL